VIEIEHIPAGGLSADIVRNFLAESAAAYPQEVGSPDLVEWPSKLARFADCFCTRRLDGSLSAALFSYLNNSDTHVGYIPFLCSLPECEKGIAYELHNAYIDCALRVDMIVSRLEVVKSNSHAYQFYLRQGYVVVEDRCDRGRLLMSKEIGK